MSNAYCYRNTFHPNLFSFWNEYFSFHMTNTINSCVIIRCVSVWQLFDNGTMCVFVVCHFCGRKFTCKLAISIVLYFTSFITYLKGYIHTDIFWSDFHGFPIAQIDIGHSLERFFRWIYIECTGVPQNRKHFINNGFILFGLANMPPKSNYLYLIFQVIIWFWH